MLPTPPPFLTSPARRILVADPAAGVTCIEALDDGNDVNEPVFVAGDSQGQLHVLVIEQVVTTLQVEGGDGVRIVAIKVADDCVLVATENKVFKYALILEKDSVPVGEWEVSREGVFMYLQ